MTTPPPDKQPAAETLEEIAHKIVKRYLDDYINDHQLEHEFLSALRNERERAVRIIDEHQALDVCKDNCWTTIKAAIREGK